MSNCLLTDWTNLFANCVVICGRGYVKMPKGTMQWLIEIFVTCATVVLDVLYHFLASNSGPQ